MCLFIVALFVWQAVPHVADGCKEILGQWMSPQDADLQLDNRLPGSMKVSVSVVVTGGGQGTISPTF